MTKDSIAPFDDLYRDSRDPWGTNTRWYERRKRALLIASLPREHYGSIYEVGCGTGHISVELSKRCTTLLASDASTGAVTLAATALAAYSNAKVVRHLLPDDWPAQPFDLTVFGEVLYFLDDRSRTRVAALARTSAGRTGTVIACDWRAAIEGRGHSGEDAHRQFEAALDLPRRFEYLDDDFVLTAWSVDTVSVAVQEGLR